MTSRLVRRGDIWWVAWEPGRGGEQEGYRPALVIQNDVGNDVGINTIIAAMTTSARRLPVIVPVSAAESGLPEDSAINLAHIMTVDKSRLNRYVGRVPEGVLAEVDQAIRVSLDLG
jgi:mRNA interferase MazF